MLAVTSEGAEGWGEVGTVGASPVPTSTQYSGESCNLNQPQVATGHIPGVKSWEWALDGLDRA